LDRLAQTHATLCLFLSVHKIEEVAERLAPQYGAGCPVAVVYRASWPDQKIVRGTLADIAAKVDAAEIKQTAMIIVGHALERHGGPVSRLYSHQFTHGYRS
jgi:precorrin-4/cobalt-precorrin-4 C11-methyltransferase